MKRSCEIPAMVPKNMRRLSCPSDAGTRGALDASVCTLPKSFLVSTDGIQCDAWNRSCSYLDKAKTTDRIGGVTISFSTADVLATAFPFSGSEGRAGEDFP